MSAGGGIKVYPVERIARRLDGRGYATFVGGEIDTLFCTPEFCFGTIDATVVWQAAFTAALVFAFRRNAV